MVRFPGDEQTVALPAAQTGIDDRIPFRQDQIRRGGEKLGPKRFGDDLSGGLDAVEGKGKDAVHVDLPYFRETASFQMLTQCHAESL